VQTTAVHIMNHLSQILQLAMIALDYHSKSSCILNQVFQVNMWC